MYMALGVDNILEFTVVLADGSHVTANAYTSSDLFWALRGGGGGTFGVTTSITYRTHPITPMLAAFFEAATTDSSQASSFQELFTEFVRCGPSFLDDGWTGYSEIIPNSTTGGSTFEFVLGGVNLPLSDGNASLTPFFEFAESLSPQVTTLNALIIPFTSFAEWYAFFQTFASPQEGFAEELGSWLLPRDVLEVNYTQVAQVVSQLPSMNY